MENNVRAGQIYRCTKTNHRYRIVAVWPRLNLLSAECVNTPTDNNYINTTSFTKVKPYILDYSITSFLINKTLDKTYMLLFEGK
jgi:hypothetical protein